MEVETQTTPQPGDSNLHFLDYWRIIRIRKMVILMVWILVVLTTTAVTYILPPTYMSSVEMEVLRDVSDITQLGSAQSSGVYDPFYIQTQFERIKSSSVLEKVITELDLHRRWAKRYGVEGELRMQETLKYLEGRMDVRSKRNTSIIEIRVYSELPKEAAEIAEKIYLAYKDNREAQAKLSTSRGIEAAREQFVTKSNIVARLHEKVDRLRKELDITEVGPEMGGTPMTLDTETIRRLEANRLDLENETVVKDEKLTTLLATQQSDPAALKTVLQSLYPDEHLAGLMQKESMTRSELVAKEKEFGQEHTEVTKPKSVLRDVSVQIEEHVKGKMIALQSEVRALKAGDEKRKRDLETAKDKARVAAERDREFYNAKTELLHERNVLESLDLKLVQETFNANIYKTYVDITAHAKEPLNPVRPIWPLNIALGVVLGLVAGVGLAFFIEYLDTSVKTIDDVERTLGASVLGVIPQNVGILLDEGLESPHAEAYRVLRTSVLFSRKDDKANAITIVSGGAGEGKSTTVFNLATVFAQNGSRVLLVDSDLRRPSLHKKLKVANNVGLTNYLLKQNTLEEVIQTTPLVGLDFLPSGKLPSSSLGILNSPQMREFVKEVKSRYDFVFFDSPPIMGVSDASIIVSLVDLSMLVVQYRKYPQAMTVRAKQTVEKVADNLLGVVMNNINISQDAYYYYYSGYNYSYSTRRDDDDDAPPGKGPKGAGEKSSAELKGKY